MKTMQHKKKKYKLPLVPTLKGKKQNIIIINI